MRGVPHRPQCQIAGCLEECDYELRAQWTIFDFIEYYACLVHVPTALRIIESKLIDGQPPQYIEQVAYDDWMLGA